MKLIELITIRKILSNHAGDRIPAMTAYKIMKFVKASDTEDAFYNEKINGIIDEYSLKDKDGNPVMKANGVQIQKERMEECNKLLSELQATEVDVPNLKLKLDEISSMQFSVEEIMALDPFIEE